MRTSAALLAALASSVYADDLFVYYSVGGEGSNITDRAYYQPTTTQVPVATVVAASPSSTRLVIGCPADSSQDCVFEGVRFEYAIISKTRFEGTMTRTANGGPVWNSWGIDYVAGAKEQLITLVQEGGNSDTNGTITGEMSSNYFGYNTVSIVSGASLLSGDMGMTAPPSTTTDSASAGQTSSEAMPTATGSTTGSATGSAPANTSTGAAAKFVVGKNALFALAGAAVLNMW